MCKALILILCSIFASIYAEWPCTTCVDNDRYEQDPKKACYLTDLNNASQFIQCSNGDPVAMPCPGDLLWHQAKLTCNVASEVSDFECKVGIGRYYSGTTAITKNGDACLSWTVANNLIGLWSSFDDTAQAIADLVAELGITHNYCRNYDNWLRPWCIIPNGISSYSIVDCTIPECPAGTEVRNVDT